MDGRLVNQPITSALPCTVFELEDQDVIISPRARNGGPILVVWAISDGERSTEGSVLFR